MGISHGPLGLASAILLAGATAMLFFIVLGGVKHTAPLSHTYFLRADTSGMTGARDVSQWNYLYVCGQGNVDCSHAHAAMPFGDAWDGDASGVPDPLIGKYGGHTTSKYYYYMWRFGWVFYLMALFFTVCAFFSSFLACCGRLGAGIGSLVTMLALFFLTLAVSLMTATFVKARNVFHSYGHSASLGRYGFGFSWGAWTALLIAMVLLCVGTRKASRSSAYANRGRGSGVGSDYAGANSSVMGENGAGDVPVKAAASPSRRGWRRYRRGRSTGSRRSRGGLRNSSFTKSTYDDNRLSAGSP